MSPVSQSVADNQPATYIEPTISGSYDSNLLKADDQRFPGPKDDYSLTPGIDAGISRLVGRTLFKTSAAVGYGIHSRFSGLDQLQATVNGSIETPVGAICTATPSAEYEIYQTDFAEIQNLSSSSAAINKKNVSRTGIYEINAGCKPAVGFSPSVDISYEQDSSNVFQYRDLNTLSAKMSLGYHKPSLGTLGFYFDIERIQHTGLAEVIGTGGTSVAHEFGLLFTRAVAPRINFTLQLGYLKVDPGEPSVSSFSGFGFNSQINYLPSPNLRLTFNARRTTEGQSTYSVDYIIREDYSGLLVWDVSVRSHLQFGATKAYRRYRGEQLLGGLPPRVRDVTTIGTASYLFDIRKSVQVGMHFSRSQRTDPNRIYDFKDSSGSLSVGLRF